MLAPKGSMTWKSAKSRFPPARAIVHFLTRTRFLIFIIITAIVVLSWRGLSGTAAEVQRYEVIIVRPSIVVFLAIDWLQSGWKGLFY